MPWPSATPGGAWSPFWGGYLKVWVRANIRAGRGWHIGPHANDRLDSGNVVGPVEDAGAGTEVERLWVDLSCDALDVELVNGSTRADGIFSRNEAATLHVTLFDPTRQYDPTNPVSPWQLRGRTRLVAGTPLECFVEIVDGTDSSVTTRRLFVGRVDRWTENWTPHPTERRAVVVGTDAVKDLVHTNYEEQSPVGNNETTTERMHRLIDYFGWSGPVDEPAVPSPVTLDATTLAQSAWEHLNRTMDDEIGYVHLRGDGTLRWVNRDTWLDPNLTPTLEIGCSPALPDALDIVTDVAILGHEEQLRNAVYASRTGGTMQIVKSEPSIAAHGGFETSFRRTDLGLADDPLVADWAQTIVTLYSFPEASPVAAVLQPQLVTPSDEVWRSVIDTLEVTDIVRLVWTPPDQPGTSTDSLVRVVGFSHKFTYRTWTVGWSLVNATTTLGVWTIGPHPNDRLDDGNVIGWTHITLPTPLEERLTDAA